jgi:hypothetical protein
MPKIDTGGFRDAEIGGDGGQLRRHDQSARRHHYEHQIEQPEQGRLESVSCGLKAALHLEIGTGCGNGSDLRRAQELRGDRDHAALISPNHRKAD